MADDTEKPADEPTAELPMEPTPVESAEAAPGPEDATATVDTEPADAGNDPVPTVPSLSGGEDADAAPALDIGGGVTVHADVPMIAPAIRGKVDRFGVAMGTGRRKTSVARVRISDGDGQIVINGRTLDDFLKTERDRKMVLAPLVATGTLEKVDVWVKVKGGGTTGQTGAILLGVARALQAKDPGLHAVLSDGGYLTRDERMVERKKYGLAKARRSFQFSKR